MKMSLGFLWIYLDTPRARLTSPNRVKCQFIILVSNFVTVEVAAQIMKCCSTPLSTCFLSTCFLCWLQYLRTKTPATHSVYLQHSSYHDTERANILVFDFLGSPLTHLVGFSLHIFAIHGHLLLMKLPLIAFDGD